MYRETTTVQVARAVAAWVLGTGMVMFPLVARSIMAGRPTSAAWVCLGIIAAGAGSIVGARWRLQQLDRLNRAFLLSPAGVSIMPARARFLEQVTVFKRACLALMMLVGTVFIVLVSATNCREGQPGFCAWLPTPGDAILTFFQLSGVTLGLIYIAGVILTRTHESETERLDAMIAHGQYERRHGGPMDGSTRRGWE